MLVRSCLALLAACAAPPADERFSVPAVETMALWRPGPLFGASSAVADVAREGAWRVELEAWWIERASTLGNPLAASARLVVSQRDGEPWETRSASFDGARIACGDEARAFDAQRASGALGRCSVLDRRSLALPSGATLAWVVRAARDGRATPVDLRFELARAGDELRACVGRSGQREHTDDAGRVTASASDEALELEHALELDGAGCVITFEAPLVFGEPRTLAVRASLHSEAAPELQATALAACADADRLALEQATWIGSEEAREQQIESALRTLLSRNHRRPALVFLAQTCGAQVCADLALGADDDTLAACIDAIAGSIDDPARIARAGGTLVWVLERGTLRFLARRGAEHPLERELAAIVARHCGELGRSLNALDDVAQSARDLADFHERVVQENLVFLEDSRAAARVRAFDWLAARGRAPRAFDPLADSESRRAALEADAQERQP